MIQKPIFSPQVEWLPPTEFPDLSKYNEIAIDLETKDPDLKTPEGIEIIKKLVKGADGFIHNFRPGAMERDGLGYDDLKQINESQNFIARIRHVNMEKKNSEETYAVKTYTKTNHIYGNDAIRHPYCEESYGR